MTHNDSAALVHRIIEEIWNQRRLDLFDELFADTFFNHNPSAGSATDRAGLQQSARILLHGFPDLHITIDDMMIDEDRVMSRLTLRGTHMNEFLDIAPTGRQIVVPSWTMLRMQHGQVVERWSIMDVFGWYKQLGIL